MTCELHPTWRKISVPCKCLDAKKLRASFTTRAQANRYESTPESNNRDCSKEHIAANAPSEKYRRQCIGLELPHADITTAIVIACSQPHICFALAADSQRRDRGKVMIQLAIKVSLTKEMPEIIAGSSSC